MSQISRSLHGDTVYWIAREGRKVVARATSRDKLEILLEERAADLAKPVVEEKEEDEPKPKKTSRKLRYKRSKKKSK